MDEVALWFRVMAVQPTTAEIARTRELFEVNKFLDSGSASGMTISCETPLARAEQFRKFSRHFFKELKLWHGLRYLPGIRGVALCNRSGLLAQDNSRDIDLFIVAKKNCVWLVRGAATLCAILWRRRRTGKVFAGRWCLSFFLEEGQSVQSLALQPVDPELLFWEANLLWLVGGSGHPSINKKAFFWPFLSIIARPFNYLAFIVQASKFKQKNDINEGVVLTPQVAKFHTIDRRRQHYDAWTKLRANVVE